MGSDGLGQLLIEFLGNPIISLIIVVYNDLPISPIHDLSTYCVTEVCQEVKTCDSYWDRFHFTFG